MRIEDLLPKLPLIVGWIDQTLAEHAIEARPVSSYGFPRLPQFYSPALLSRMKVIVVDKVPMPPLSKLGLNEFAAFENGNFAGITYKDTYFVQASLAMDESLHFHELVHTVQWEHLGAKPFLVAYAAGLSEKGYKDSPLEAMAYGLQDYFVKNGQPINVESFVRTKLDELNRI